jgi:hypothetical protein
MEGVGVVGVLFEYFTIQPGSFIKSAGLLVGESGLNSLVGHSMDYCRGRGKVPAR